MPSKQQQQKFEDVTLMYSYLKGTFFTKLSFIVDVIWTYNCILNVQNFYVTFTREFIHQGTFRHINLETNTGKFWMFAVWSDKFAKWTINMWCAVYSVQYVVWSVHIQIQGHLQVLGAVCRCWVQCAGCSVLPAKYEDLAVETGWVKLKFYLKK